MEYIISPQAGIIKLPIFCETENCTLEIEVDMSKFQNQKTVTIECKCHLETFIIQRKVILNASAIKNEI